jgi:flagellar hook protein FlgE
MIQSLFAGVSGMLANQDEMDVIGNNIANANTTAFKSSTADFEESFDQITRTATVNQPVGLSVGLGAQVSGTTTDFTQGVFQTTNVPTDMAINGSGFFTVQSVGGTNYVTRNGAFVEDSNGNLRTSSGDFLMGSMGTTPPASPSSGYPPDKITIPATITGVGGTSTPVVSFAVDPTGAVSVTGQDGTSQVVGFITVQSYNNNNGLVDDGGGLYSYQAAAGTNQYFSGGSAGAGTIQTGVLEASNTDLSTEFANMIIAQRGFEAAARVISVSDSMLQTVTDLKTQ